MRKLWRNLRRNVLLAALMFGAAAFFAIMAIRLGIEASLLGRLSFFGAFLASGAAMGLLDGKIFQWMIVAAGFGVAAAILSFPGVTIPPAIRDNPIGPIGR